MVELRSARVVLALVPAIVLGACGGGGVASKGASTGDQGKGDGPQDSVGRLAVEQGGVHWGSAQKGSPADAILAGTLHAEVMDKDAPVKLDGVLKEWPPRVPAKTVVKGGGSVAMSADLQYDAEKIYLAAEISDEHLYRTSRFGENEDHASFVVAFPTGSSWATYEIGLYAGKPGESVGSVRFLAGGKKGQEVPGSKIVEAPAGKGYTFEAVIPWATFPESRTTRLGLRGVMRYYDSDGSQIKTILATGEGDASSPDKLPPMPTQAEISLMEGLLGPKNWMDKKPSFELIADVAGDGMKEKIAVYDRVFVIYGPGYREGKQFFYRDTGGDVVEMTARDVTGRGKDDIVLRRRFPVGSSGAYREWFEVWSCAAGDEPTTTFAHEIAVASGGKKVTNSVRASMKEIEISIEPASGWDASTYREPTTTDVDPVLLPWGAVKSRTFRFDGSKFVKLKQVDQTPAPGAEPEKVARGSFPDTSKQPPTPPVKQGGDLSAQLLESFRRDRSVPADVKPKFDLQVNVAEDARPERVVLLGRDIVVFGPGFKGGNGYAFITLSQFADAADINDLTTRDMNGDGAANLIVRGVRHVTPQGGGDRLDIDAMFIYELKGENIQRIFAIETAREQGGKRVQGLVQFVPAKSGKGFDIDVRPGTAKGWNEKTYPWPQDKPGGPIEPLLLPWGGIPSIRYAWNGSQFAPAK
jgi:hypothetical protein